MPTGQQTVEILLPVNVTLSDATTAGALVIGAGSILEIGPGGSLTVAGNMDNAGTIILDDPFLIYSGMATLTGGGTIEMIGPTTLNVITGAPGTVLTNVDNTIIGSGSIGQGDGHLTFVNEGTVNATPLQAGDSGLIVIHTANPVTNIGTLEATVTAANASATAPNGGGTLQILDSLNNSGTVAAIGTGASVLLNNNSPETGDTVPANADINTGTIEAINGGLLTIENTTIVNSTFNPTTNTGTDGTIAAGAASQINLEGATILQGFVSIAAGGEIETVSGTSNTINTANGPRSQHDGRHHRQCRLIAGERQQLADARKSLQHRKLGDR